MTLPEPDQERTSKAAICKPLVDFNVTKVKISFLHSEEDFHIDKPSIDQKTIESPTLEVVSLPIGCSKVKTHGTVLPEGRRQGEASNPVIKKSTRKPSEKRESKSKLTRVRPPRDVVKLKDRLQYLLQPPLESLIEADSLRFPFKPFPYQMDGVAFLFPRKHAVVADEMGLGKTMQSITSIRLLAHSGQIRRVLLVCPKPLISNWQRELSLWAPELSVATIDGSPSQRSWVWKASGAVVMIIGYETLVRDQTMLEEDEQHFDLVLLDESQRIKNRNSTTNQVVRTISRDRSWALTGTPIENSIDDLVGIFDFVSPGLLREGMSAHAIGSAVQDSVIRRTKEKVLTELPPKIIRDANVDLTPEQLEAYTRAEEEGVIQLKDKRHELTIHHVFELVLRLKQVCNFDPLTGASSKADRLEADLEECVASGRKAIVFSQWVDSIEQLAERLERFGVRQFHGKIPHRQRDMVLNQFRDDPNCHVLCMSYGAGSVGLNLQFAGYVFLFDRWWNPAVEDQAINRAHRIGAAGPVTVSRFLCSNTIEERIDAILQQKRELFAKVFDSDIQVDGNRSAGLSRDELFSLFELELPSEKDRAA